MLKTVISTNQTQHILLRKICFFNLITIAFCVLSKINPVDLKPLHNKKKQIFKILNLQFENIKIPGKVPLLYFKQTRYR